MPAWLVGGTRQRRRWFLCIRSGIDQQRSRCLTAHSNRWKTGSDFAIGLISSPRWQRDTERKRRPSNDRVAGNKTEKKTVLPTPRGTSLRSAALSKRPKALPNQRSVPRRNRAQAGRLNPRSESARSRVENWSISSAAQAAHAHTVARINWTDALEVETENKRARLAAEPLVDDARGGTAWRFAASAEQGTGCKAAFFVSLRWLPRGNA